MLERSSAVRASAGSYAGMGAPIRMWIGKLCRPSRFGMSLVQTRCAPQIVIGTIGAPESIAIRAAPDLNSLISKLRLIVASG
ncbi:hypothetical protein GCM10027089_21230 [Nocardia thraciensis]